MKQDHELRQGSMGVFEEISVSEKRNKNSLREHGETTGCVGCTSEVCTVHSKHVAVGFLSCSRVVAPVQIRVRFNQAWGCFGRE